MTKEDALQELKDRLLEVSDLEAASRVLFWDQTTYMPPQGAAARGRQLALLARLAHEKFTAAAVGKLLETLSAYEQELPYDSDEASLIRVARRDSIRATRVPAAFLTEFYAHAAQTYQAWTEARPANDFAGIQERLETTLDLSRKLADFFPGYEHIADPLIEMSDEGMKVSRLRPLFAELRKGLVPLLEAIAARPPVDDGPLRGRYPEAEQLKFGLEVIKRFGYDLSRGRQDVSPHPFMIRFSSGDVRITTRVKEDDLSDALFSTLHEAGHALYELGVDAGLEGTLLAGGTSAGVHESQSRLWENLVGRSYGFWEHFYPKLQETFPDQLSTVLLEGFHRAVNKVVPSLIRTDADEVTYNLHVILRFDLELALLEGELEVKDLPQAWRERYASDLGVVPDDDRDGVLQDVHWFGGGIGGAFQGYTLGNILSAQFYEAALAAHPKIPEETRRGEFGTLHGWLRENLYRHGRKFTADEVTERATGKPLTVEPYLHYLRAKYGELYDL